MKLLYLLPLFVSFSHEECPPLQKTGPGVVVDCLHNKTSVSCNQSVPDGTWAIYKCEDYYTNTCTGSKDSRRLCVKNGWTQRPPFTCSLECGKKGGVTSRTEWPWHAAIYFRIIAQQWVYSCGGSLIEDRFVVTASRCFEAFNSREYSDMKVVLGKYHVNYIVIDDDQQEVGVRSVLIHKSDSTSPIRNDIAIVVLDHPVQPAWNVRPVCLPWKGETDSIKSDADGVIPGWGVTSNETHFDKLHATKLPYVNLSTCYEDFPLIDIRNNFGEDILCSSLYNITEDVCSSDLGSGLSFKHEDRWYLHGVFSWRADPKDIDVTPKQCDPAVSFFTKVNLLMDWIDYISFSESGIATTIATTTTTAAPEWEGTCQDDRCCKGLTQPNPITGSGYAEYTKRCLQGGLHCIGNSGCAVCWCPRPYPNGVNEGNRPKCALPC